MQALSEFNMDVHSGILFCWTQATSIIRLDQGILSQLPVLLQMPLQLNTTDLKPRLR